MQLPGRTHAALTVRIVYDTTMYAASFAVGNACASRTRTESEVA